MTDQLLPCPWCGELPDWFTERSTFLVCIKGECPVNPMVTGKKTRKESIEAWNTRNGLTPEQMCDRLLGHHPNYEEIKGAVTAHTTERSTEMLEIIKRFRVDERKKQFKEKFIDIHFIGNK